VLSWKPSSFLFLLCFTRRDDGSFGDPRRSRVGSASPIRFLPWKATGESMGRSMKSGMVVQSKSWSYAYWARSFYRSDSGIISLHRGPNRLFLRLCHLLYPRQSSRSRPQKQTERGIAWTDHSLVLACVGQNGESS